MLNKANKKDDRRSYKLKVLVSNFSMKEAQLNLNKRSSNQFQSKIVKKMNMKMVLIYGLKFWTSTCMVV